MKRLPEFSIIVPIYKVEPYLRQCIDSILAQTYPDFELILVDDGSPDNCGKICDEYATADARVKVIHKPNGGLVSARKAGVQLASGKYILNIDGDDYIGSNLLQTLHTIIAEHAPDLVAFGLKKVKNDGMITQIDLNGLSADRLYRTQEAGFYDALVYDRRIGHFNYGPILPSIWSKAAKREIMVPAMLAVPDDVVMGEDLAATNQALCMCNTVFISGATEYYYRFNDQSLTNTFRRDMLQRRQVLFEFMNTHLDKIPQANKDAYACMQMISHIAGAVKSFDRRGDFLRYIRAEMTPELHAIVDRCRIPKLPPKQWILFALLKRNCYVGFWEIYHTLRKQKSHTETPQ